MFGYMKHYSSYFDSPAYSLCNMNMDDFCHNASVHFFFKLLKQVFLERRVFSFL